MTLSTCRSAPPVPRVVTCEFVGTPRRKDTVPPSPPLASQAQYPSGHWWPLPSPGRGHFFGAMSATGTDENTDPVWTSRPFPIMGIGHV